MGRKANTVERMLGRYVRYEDQCWVWTGKVQDNGYGQVGMNYKSVLAHRAVYEALIGPIPDGYTLDHTCENKACVNPKHLEPVTSGDNTRRYYDRQTHCRNGHLKTAENTYVSPDGMRNCRACRAESAARFAAKE